MEAKRLKGSASHQKRLKVRDAVTLQAVTFHLFTFSPFNLPFYSNRILGLTKLYRISAIAELAIKTIANIKVPA